MVRGPVESLWDPDDDGSQTDEESERGDEQPEAECPPSSSEMAGDGAVGGDGLDEPGWD